MEMNLEQDLTCVLLNKNNKNNSNFSSTKDADSLLLLNKDKTHILERTASFKERQHRENKRIISKLSKVCIFCSIFMTVELIGGYVANSLAIMTDAAHLLSDLSGFLISMISLYIALRPADNKLTYGYHRAEIIGSLVSISIIWLLTAWLIFEAFERLFNPRPIRALIMLGIACLGLTFNIIMAKILMSDEEITNKFEEESDKTIYVHKYEINNDNGRENILMTSNKKVGLKDIKDINDNNSNLDIVPVNNENSDNDKTNNSNTKLDKEENPVLRATFIHILGDMIQSVGVVLASSLIYFLQDSHPLIVRVDPICTFIFGIIVLSTSIPVARDCINVLMEAAPMSIKQAELLNEFRDIPDVVDFHDIHIWCLSIGKVALTAHFISNNPQKTLEQATDISKKYGIFHSTIQVEDYTQRRRNSFKICTHINDNQIH